MVAAAKGGQRVGSIRVSSMDQNTERQLDGVSVDETFKGKVSGKDTNRPQLQAASKHVRKGDVLVVHSMDRLARSLSDLLTLVKELTHRGVTVEFVKENLHFTGDDSPHSVLMLQIMGAVAQFERSIIKERQREGIAAAKEAGRHLGRVAILDKKQTAALRKLIAAGESREVVAKAFGISRASTYNYTR